MFLQASVILLTGGGVWDTTPTHPPVTTYPLDYVPPRLHTPPGLRTPWDYVPPLGTTYPPDYIPPALHTHLDYIPPRTMYPPGTTYPPGLRTPPRGRSMCSWYASYWNAFLLISIIYSVFLWIVFQAISLYYSRSFFLPDS